ncbi:MAG: hypothetical protein R3A80_06960 [Bdellovibrionota bacterium]
MSKNLNTKFPDAISKRDILHGHKKMSDDQKKALGRGLVSEGWYSDAIDFLTTEPDELAKIKNAAIEEGNIFLLTKLFRVLGQENDDEVLRASMKAEELGKIRYAIKGYEKLGKTEKADSLKELIAADGDMKTELNDVFIPKSEEERLDDGEE